MARYKLKPVLARDPEYSGAVTIGTRQSASPEESPGPALRDQDLSPVIADPQVTEPESEAPAAETPLTPAAPSPAASETTPLAGAEPSRPRHRAPKVTPAPEPVPIPEEDAGSEPRTNMVRVAVNVRPLARQAERIKATGLRPQDVLKAAWRTAVASYTVTPSYVEAPAGKRAGGATFLYNTTLTVEQEPLAALAQANDPLGVKSAWWLIRGQLEPTFWAALDDLLTRLAKPKP
jgi:hypothetical protein